jgi:hypothetical protein
MVPGMVTPASIAQRDHGVCLSYSFVKPGPAGRRAGAQGRPRGRHRRRREPRPCFGELLDLDGSRHRWLALVPDTLHTLIAVVDDATKRLLYAHLLESGESVDAILTALRQVFTTYGIPGALYTDRAHWPPCTRRLRHRPGSHPGDPGRSDPGAPGRRAHPRLLAPGRGAQRATNGTLQGAWSTSSAWPASRRWPPPIATCANGSCPSTAPPSAGSRPIPPAPSCPWASTTLEQILCHEEECVVARDNPVTFGRLVLQITKHRGLRSCAGLRVLVRRHLDGRHSIWWGPRCLGRYSGQGRLLAPKAA